MTLNQTERLLKVLCAHGVSHFKDRDLEIRIENPHSLGKFSVTQPTVLKGAAAGDPPTPPSAAAAPPVNVEIPHHMNEVAKLLKLDDEHLAERLFPAGEAPEIEVPAYEGPVTGKAE